MAVDNELCQVLQLEPTLGLTMESQKIVPKVAMLAK